MFSPSGAVAVVMQGYQQRHPLPVPVGEQFLERGRRPGGMGRRVCREVASEQQQLAGCVRPGRGRSVPGDRRRRCRSTTALPHPRPPGGVGEPGEAATPGLAHPRGQHPRAHPHSRARPVNLAAWTPDPPGHRRRLAEVPDYIAGCVPLHELVHSQAPDRTVREVQTTDCCLNSYLVKEIINPRVAVDGLGGSLLPGCCHGRSFGRSRSTCQSRRGRSRLPLGTIRFALWLCGGELDGRGRYMVPPPLWLLRQGKNATRRTLRPCCHGLTTGHCRTLRPRQSP